MPALGAIMTLSKETGVDKKTAKAALVEHADDYEAALAQLHGAAAPDERSHAASSGDRKGIRTPSLPIWSDILAQHHLRISRLGGRLGSPLATGADPSACSLQALQAEHDAEHDTVSVIRIEVGDDETYPEYGDSLQ